LDLNLVVLAGRLAAPVEVRDLGEGGRLARYLITVGTDQPQRRIDVVPVTLWNPPTDLDAVSPGTRMWVAGMVQRRFRPNGEQGGSRLEIIAHHVELRPGDEEGVTGV